MNNKKRRKEIRKAVGLPDDNGHILGIVGENPAELCENTMTNKCEPGMPSGANKTKHAIERGFSSSVCQDGTPFDFGASGGATSPNTEVNADHQGVISEVPRRTTPHPR